MKVLEIILIVVCVLLIAIVLLQSSKAEGASQIITGGNADLFKNRKERGSELFISRATFILGIIFFIICLVISFM
jgi:protein translocase, SecG subunit